MASEYRRRRRVEFSETDAAGIVHFSSYFRYMEETEHEFLRSLGLSVKLTVDGRRLGFPRLAARCEFIRPLCFEDEVDIELRVARKGRSSLKYQFLFRLAGDPVARGEVSAVCCRHGEDGSLTPVSLPRVFTEQIGESPLPPLEFRSTEKKGRRGRAE